METTVIFNPGKVKTAASVRRAVNHKLRQKMLRLIEAHGKVAVTDIYKKLRMEQSVCSQHLAILRRAGIVIAEREGRFIYYSVNCDMLELIDEVAGRLIDQKTTLKTCSI